MRRRPQHAADSGDGVTERWFRLGVPCCDVWTQDVRGAASQAIGPHGDQREQREQRRGGAQDRQVRPLPLRLHAEMGPHFLKRGLDAQPATILGWLRVEIGAEKRGWLMLAGWVTDQNPAD